MEHAVLRRGSDKQPMPDQTPFWAAIATIVVWVAITAISVMFLLMMRPDAVLAALFVASMAGIGVAGTHVVWDNIVKLRRINMEGELQRRDDETRRGRTWSIPSRGTQ